MRENTRERENQRDGERGNESQWKVVFRRKPNSHWRAGQPTYNRVSWNQSGRGGASGRARVTDWIEDETFSIFVDNLPYDVTRTWLWEAFSSTGRVVDVYLSRKIRKSNQLGFAFIRYKSKEEVLRTIEQLDGWIVRGCSLKVTESRYKRSGRGRNGIGGKGDEKVNPESEPGPERSENSKQMTYRDILMKGKQGEDPKPDGEYRALQTLGDSKIYLEEDKEAKENLYRCLVGEMLMSYDFESLRDSLMME
ncbi:hypothetical protein PIB30_056245 [Stylosanthes scabra]|uniref:RRM domain-containing protein n=1 Tax=Stylosanthes scabra TaxID=79078 RepID=A0ABU6VHT4_9FABA|nr:hypothetical protein [Stylosanthes scabra]